MCICTNIYGSIAIMTSTLNHYITWSFRYGDTTTSSMLQLNIEKCVAMTLTTKIISSQDTQISIINETVSMSPLLLHTYFPPFDLKQGKSEGFESCDRPIVRKCPIWVKIGDVLYRVTLKFDGWPWKTIGHLSFAVSSFVQHFIAIGEFKLELQSGNAQFGSIQQFLVPCDLEIWRMTLKNNRAPLLCYFKLYASFRSHWWIEAGVTVRKPPIWVKIDDFFSRVTLQFDVWPWKTIGHLFYSTSSFVHHFVAIGDFKLELQSGNTQFGSNSTIFRAVRPWNLTDDLE